MNILHPDITSLRCRRLSSVGMRWISSQRSRNTLKVIGVIAKGRQELRCTHQIFVKSQERGTKKSTHVYSMVFYTKRDLNFSAGDIRAFDDRRSTDPDLPCISAGCISCEPSNTISFPSIHLVADRLARQPQLSAEKRTRAQMCFSYFADLGLMD